MGTSSKIHVKAEPAREPNIHNDAHGDRRGMPGTSPGTKPARGKKWQGDLGRHMNETPATGGRCSSPGGMVHELASYLFAQGGGVELVGGPGCNVVHDVVKAEAPSMPFRESTAILCRWYPNLCRGKQTPTKRRSKYVQGEAFDEFHESKRLLIVNAAFVAATLRLFPSSLLISRRTGAVVAAIPSSSGSCSRFSWRNT